MEVRCSLLPPCGLGARSLWLPVLLCWSLGLTQPPFAIQVKGHFLLSSATRAQQVAVSIPYSIHILEKLTSSSSYSWIISHALSFLHTSELQPLVSFPLDSLFSLLSLLQPWVTGVEGNT